MCACAITLHDRHDGEPSTLLPRAVPRWETSRAGAFGAWTYWTTMYVGLGLQEPFAARQDVEDWGAEWSGNVHLQCGQVRTGWHHLRGCDVIAALIG